MAHLIKCEKQAHALIAQCLANALYMASNRQDKNYDPGEPCYWDHVIIFNSLEIDIVKPRAFVCFLSALYSSLRSVPADALDVVEVAHPDAGKGGIEYRPNYTFKSYPAEWHECPFNSRREAEQWAKAIPGGFRIEKVPTLWAKAKPRDFAAARRFAVWPEATDAELSLPYDELKQLLDARLPVLLEEFKNGKEIGGFLFSPKG